MRRFVTLFFWIFLACLGVVVIAAAAFIVFLTVTQYHPDPAEDLNVEGKNAEEIKERKEFTVMSWNIGYAGLGKEMDFFYEGGKMVRPGPEKFRNYINGIIETVRVNDSLDFILIQEADINSSRSYYSDQATGLSAALPGHYFAFAKNYDCRYVPVPLYGPMGKVVSGIISFSRYQPVSATRIDFGTKFPWPKNLVFLRRCFLVMRFKLTGDRELVLINTHNSVFDEEGQLRKKEMEKLNDFMTSEYRKGNFVVAGGDWNQNPRGFIMSDIKTGDRVKTIDLPFAESILSGWQFIFDPGLPTNRDVDMDYLKGKTKTTIIDFFVTSPNVTVLSVKTLNTGFENSDHQPVIMKIKIQE